MGNTKWENSNEYKRIQEVLYDYWLTEPDEKQVTVIMDFQHENGEEQAKQVIWRNPNNKTVATKKKRVRKELADYYEAGALYRLWKDIGIAAARKLSEISQETKASNALLNAVHTVDLLETRLGFENCLQADHSDLTDKDFCAMFYGAIGANRDNNTDTEIHECLQKILRELLQKCYKKQANEDDDIVRIRRRMPKNPSVVDDIVSIKFIKSGSIATGAQRYSISFRFSMEMKDKISSTGFVEFAFNKKNKRLYILESDATYGYKISTAEQTSKTCSAKFTCVDHMEIYEKCVGEHQLVKDEIKNAYYFELK